MQTIDDANFAAITSSGLVVVDFYAEWCRPCHLLADTLNKLASQNPGVKFGKVNIDESKNATQEHSINAVPTVILFKDGKPVKRFIGLQTESVLNEAISANV